MTTSSMSSTNAGTDGAPHRVSDRGAWAAAVLPLFATAGLILTVALLAPPRGLSAAAFTMGAQRPAVGDSADTDTSTVTPVATPQPGAPVFFPVGQGVADVVPHQLVRAGDDRLYVFAAQAQYSSTLRAYWTVAPGLPAAPADFGGGADVSQAAAIISVDAAYDGSRTVHVLVNTQD